MRRTPIRMKLAAALAVPLIGLLLVTVVEVVDTGREVDDVHGQTELARASIGPSGLLTSLQNERTWAVIELIDQEGQVQPPVIGYEDSRAATNQALDAFRSTLSSQSGDVADTYREPLANLSELAALRASIDASPEPRDLTNMEFSDEVFNSYAELIQPFLDANTQVALAVDDAELRQATSLVDTTSRQIETLSELARTTSLEMALGGGLDEPGEIAAVAKVKAEFDEANDELRDAAAPLDDVVGPVFPEDLATDFADQLDTAMTGEIVPLADVLATLDVPADGGYMAVRDVLVDALNERADALNDAARNRERLYVALACLTVALALALSWLVSRSITKPLRSLTQQAKEMAERRLPDAVVDVLETPLGENISVPQVAPVRVRTSDEVADVADALNTVQDTALDLAVEQAVLRRNIADSFVNLGRRNQNLLGRQLDFITELETNETDADNLANLFRLDHLATRMRRNAESLLVLAGIEPPRQWTAPVRITDVIRAALGEVEDYQRVSVRGVEPATILGSAAADLAHLLAELIENALVFSPPDVPVAIRGRHRDAAGGRAEVATDGGYILAIIDSGLGMSTTDISAANRRLAGAESFTIAPSKYLGHYVAGNLAARHDIRVHLDNSPDNGITATITIPPALLTTDAGLAAPVTPPGGTRMVGGPKRLPTNVAGPPAISAPAAMAAPPVGVTPPSAGPGSTPPSAPPASGPTPGAVPVPPAAAMSPVPPAGTIPTPTPIPAPPRLTGRAPTPSDEDRRVPQSNHASPAAPGTPPDGTRRTGPLWPGSLPLAPGRRDGSPGTGGPVPGRDRSGGLPPTRSGLARRAPNASDEPAPAPLGPDLLAALARHAASVRAPTPGPSDGRQAAPHRRGERLPGRGDPAGPPPEPTRGAPAAPIHRPPTAPESPFGQQPNAPSAAPGASPLTPPDALTRRVRGAQLPRTSVISLHDRLGGHRPATEATDPAAAPSGPSGHAPLTPGASKATDVQTLLANFTAGVQRGLSDARSGGGPQTRH